MLVKCACWGSGQVVVKCPCWGSRWSAGEVCLLSQTASVLLVKCARWGSRQSAGRKCACWAPGGLLVKCACWAPGDLLELPPADRAPPIWDSVGGAGTIANAPTYRCLMQLGYGWQYCCATSLFQPPEVVAHAVPARLTTSEHAQKKFKIYISLG